MLTGMFDSTGLKSVSLGNVEFVPWFKSYENSDASSYAVEDPLLYTRALDCITLASRGVESVEAAAKDMLVRIVELIGFQAVKLQFW